MDEEQERICQVLDQRMKDQAILDWAYRNRIDRPIELFWTGHMINSNRNLVGVMMEK